MLQKIKSLITDAGISAPVIFETKKMSNVAADAIARDTDVIFLEEFRGGEVSLEGYIPTLTVDIEMYIARVNIAMHATAEEREAIREQLFNDIAKPFIAQYKKLVDSSKNIRILFPPPLFDANEVGISLIFKIKEHLCI